jgi:hypothetical protein
MYKNPEGIEEFFDYLIQLECSRTDEESPLYCKIIEWHKDSFLYFPAVLVVVNEEAGVEIINNLQALNLTAVIHIERFEGENIRNLTLTEINSVET